MPYLRIAVHHCIYSFRVQRSCVDMFYLEEDNTDAITSRIYFIYREHSLLSREHMNPQLTCSQRQWLHSSVSRASHRYREVTGSNPVEVLNFFQASLRNYITCIHCDDHFFILFLFFFCFQLIVFLFFLLSKLSKSMKCNAYICYSCT